MGSTQAQGKRRGRWWRRALMLAIGALVLAITGYSIYVGEFYHADPQDTTLLGQTTLCSDSPAAVRVLVRNCVTSRPVAGATVRLHLEGETGQAELGAFTTGDDGTLAETFHVPPVAPGRYLLIVETRSRIGRDSISRDVEVRRPCRLYLATDKPSYQPAQTIHLRAMAVSRATVRPLRDEEVAFEVEDPKGNKVFRATRKASAFGIASADFALAEEVNLGLYKARATAGGVETEKQLVVKRYVLPRFKVALAPDRAYALGGEAVKGEVRAEYFFGKPVAGAQVEVAGRLADGATLAATGRTDAHGAFAFSLPLGKVAAKVFKEGQDTDLELKAAVTDGAGHTEEATTHTALAQAPLKVCILPESDEIVRGVENLIYVLATYPDGSPAACRVRVGKAELATDANGVAVHAFTPPFGETLSLPATATDAAGNEGTTTFGAASDQSTDERAFLVRPDRAVYQPGQPVAVSVLSHDRSATCYLDVLKDGQTVLTRAIEVNGGKGALTIQLPGGLFGTLRLNAYRLMPEGRRVGDSRVIHVLQQRRLTIAATMDKATYRPGETANLAFEVSDAQGRPTPAALGLCGVDEAVFHLGGNRPGDLERALLADGDLLRHTSHVRHACLRKLFSPRDEDQPLALALLSTARGWSVADLATLVGDALPAEELERLRENFAEGAYGRLLEEPQFAHLAAALKGGDYSLHATTRPAKVAATERYRKQYFETLKSAFTVLCLAGVALVPLVVSVAGALRFAATWRAYRLSPSQVTARLALTGYIQGAGLLFALPVTIYVACALASPLLELDHTDRGLQGLFLGALAVEAIFTFVILALQVTWCLDLSGARETHRVGSRLMLIPLLHGIQFVLTRAVIFAGPLGYAGGDARWAAILVSFLATLTLVALAGTLGCAAARERGVSVSGGRWGAWTACIVALLLVAGMLMPALARAREEARRIRYRNDLNLLDRVLTSAEPRVERVGSPAPRLRKDFPETLLWQPELITDERGRATLAVPLADSITNWRVSADAVSADGMLGSAETGIRAFQDFFVDLDLPAALTQNDELSLPVACYNYLDRPQTVELTLEAGPWCRLLSAASQRVELAPNEVSAAHFRIRAEGVGSHKLTVAARGTALSDAVERAVRVVPDGTKVERVESGELGSEAEHAVELPPAAIPGSHSLVLKLYPSRFSEVVEGLENVFRMPYGCFEQTSSCTYPNVLALDYLQRMRRSTLQAEAKARECINAGYQRLLTFEVPGGGFSLFGQPPADAVLTAYGILEFTDMARVYSIDHAVIDRARTWLFAQQRLDGSWGGGRGAYTWGEVSGELLTTAYVAWALAEARCAGPELTRALGYVQERVDDLKSAYEQALAANAFLAADGWEPTGRGLVERLGGQLKTGAEGAWAESGGYGPMLSRGASLNVESTALAALALTRSGQHSNLAKAKKALAWLARQKDAAGTWGTTQATILAIKALLAGSGAPLGADAASDIAVTVNGRPAGSVHVTPETSEVLHLLSLTEHVRQGKNTVRLVGREGGAGPYQLVSVWWAPRGAPAPGARPLAIEVRHDKTRLAVGEALTCSVKVQASGSEAVAMPLVQLGLPPGFALDARALDTLVERGRVARYELAPTHCTLYLRELRPDAPLEFACKLVPRCAMKARIPASRVYEYYNPENRAATEPAEITVGP